FRFMKRLAHAFVFKYNLGLLGTTVEIFTSITEDSIENKRRVWGLMHVIEVNGKQMSLKDFEQMLLDNNALTAYGEQSDLPERLANDFYQKIDAALPNKIGLVLQQMTNEL